MVGRGTGRGRGRGRGGTRRPVGPPSVQQPSSYSVYPTAPIEYGAIPVSTSTAPVLPGAAHGLAPTRQAPKPLYLQDLPLPPPKKSFSEDDKLYLSFSRNFDQWLRCSPYHLKAKAAPPDILRYSDKYKKLEESLSFNIHDIQTDMTSLPNELQYVYRPEKAKQGANRLSLTTSLFDKLNFEELEKLEKLENAKTVGGDGKENLDEDENEYMEEEDHDLDDEENDYNANYFDPGDDYGDEEEGGGGEW